MHPELLNLMHPGMLNLNLRRQPVLQQTAPGSGAAWAGQMALLCSVQVEQVRQVPVLRPGLC